MRVHVITLFPDVIESYINTSMLARGRKSGAIEIVVRQLRDFAFDRHQVVDDNPYGGGVGLVLKPDIIDRAIRNALGEIKSDSPENVPIVLTTPHGRKLDNSIARHYSTVPEWIVICGHYGGVDRRIADSWVTDEISIGDYVLTGGELPALAMIDAAARFIPGVLGKIESAEQDTFEDDLLGPPVYTRPEDFKGMVVPGVLLSGNHAEVARWKRRKQLELTYRRRPDLIEKAGLTEEDIVFLESIGYKRNNNVR
ncbi:MAG TPA: tRNA (guanosine(37)-N1)-methyltransferase TrmD [bacterium]|nr:tRNA (guanosine(37)-N1)-methyltransferase TrmD [bacterium]